MPTMKHILRKLHIGGSHDNFGDRHHVVGGRVLDNGEDSVEASGHAESDQRLSSGISGWLNSARHTLRPSHASHGGSRSRLNSPGATNASLDTARTRSQDADADDLNGFQYYEEEYQVQLALALSVSNSDLHDDPESVQIRAAKRISLGRPPSPGSTPAEFTAHKYRNYNVLDYEEKVVDGFYDVYGLVSDYGAMPSLVDVQGTPIADNLGYEVILVNRDIDHDLVQLEQAALCLALDCGSDEASSYQSCLIQKIADLVVEHMGGPVIDATDMLKRWRIKNFELHSSLNNIVLPLGCLQIGLSRHRALLYKVLADHVGVPCRLVKGSHYTGIDEGAVNIVKLDDGREYIIDLMGAPGTLLPAEVVGATSQMDQVDVHSMDNDSLQNRIEENILCSGDIEGNPFHVPTEQCGQAKSDLNLLTDDLGKNFCGERQHNELAPSGSLVCLPEWFGSGRSHLEHGSIIGGGMKEIPQQVFEKVPKWTADMMLRNIHSDSSGKIPQLGPSQVSGIINSGMPEGGHQTLGFLEPLKAFELEHHHEPFSNMITSLSPMALVDGLQASSKLSEQVPDCTVLSAKESMILDPCFAAEKSHHLMETSRCNTLASAGKHPSAVALSSDVHSLPQLKELSGERLSREVPVTDVVSCNIGVGDWRHTSKNDEDHHVDYGTNVDEGNRRKKQNVVKISHDYPSGKASPILDDVAEWEIPWEDIIIGDRVGLGSYGEVYLGVWHKIEVAVKKLLDQGLSGDALDDFISEVRIMRRMQHPNVVLFIGAVTRPPNLSIVTEYLPRGSLFRLLHHPNNQLDEKLRLKMALDVAEGMNYLHTSVPVIVHRDLKSPNLLVDKNWVVKVCDFGLSRTKHRSFLSSRSTAGTPEWMAPEVLRNEPSNEKCDVYSFGVILWELATFQEPWSGMNPMQVVGAVGFQSRRLEIPKIVDPKVARIIQECWQSDPRKRPSFAQLIALLKSLQRLNATQPVVLA